MIDLSWRTSGTHSHSVPLCNVFIMSHRNSQLPDTALQLMVICLHLVGDAFFFKPVLIVDAQSHSLDRFLSVFLASSDNCISLFCIVLNCFLLA